MNTQIVELMAKNGPVYYAVNGDSAVGWCDVFPEENPRQSQVELNVYTSNTSAIALYKKFGFEQEG